MSRLAVAAVTLLGLGASSVVSLPAGGSPARSPVIQAGGEQPPALESLEALSVLALLDAYRPSRRTRAPGRTPPHGRPEPQPHMCFPDGPGGACVRVCTQFISARECDRFPSPADGCLRFAAEVPPCRDVEPLPPYTRQTLDDSPFRAQSAPPPP